MEKQVCNCVYCQGKHAHKHEEKPMTRMENAVMHYTGCTRQIANSVVNAILDIHDETNKE
jgi:hypothetical protein